jgi:D-inositol-3-phosphate glycosyltransferase
MSVCAPQDGAAPGLAPSDPMSTEANHDQPVLMVDPGCFTPYYDVNLAEGLAQHGWNVRWVTSDYEFEAIVTPATIGVHKPFFRLLGNPRRHRLLGLRSLKPFRVAAKGACYPIDMARFTLASSRAPRGILHVQWAHLPRLDAAIWDRWKQRGWKIVYTAHDVMPLSGTTPSVLSRGVPRLIALADAVVVHTRVAEAGVIAMGGHPSRVHVVPPAPPLQPNAPKWNRRDARAALGLSVDIPTILFFGFVKPYKGLDVLLRSLPTVIAAVGPVHLVIAGESMMSLSKYHGLASRLGIASAIRWVDGFVPSESVGLYFAAADVVALPYVEGSASGVLLAAYAYGRPVVATDVGGTSEFVEQGESGFVVPAGDPDALAGGLAEVLSKPELASRMAERAGCLARETYTWEATARCLDQVYRELPA